MRVRTLECDRNLEIGRRGLRNKLVLLFIKGKVKKEIFDAIRVDLERRLSTKEVDQLLA